MLNYNNISLIHSLLTCTNVANQGENDTRENICGNANAKYTSVAWYSQFHEELSAFKQNNRCSTEIKTK